jgi:hypothetical protein
MYSHTIVWYLSISRDIEALSSRIRVLGSASSLNCFEKLRKKIKKVTRSTRGNEQTICFEEVEESGSM